MPLMEAGTHSSLHVHALAPTPTRDALVRRRTRIRARPSSSDSESVCVPAARTACESAVCACVLSAAAARGLPSFIWLSLSCQVLQQLALRAALTFVGHFHAPLTRPRLRPSFWAEGARWAASQYAVCSLGVLPDLSSRSPAFQMPQTARRCLPKGRAGSGSSFLNIQLNI